jgi:hypothetical protein
MGKVVKVEKLDKSGKRHEIMEEEWTALVGDDETEDIEVALEEAFEAGIAAVLGDPYDDDQADEDDEEKAVRRLLIHRLLGRHPVQRRILQRVLVNRLLRRRLLKRSVR